MQTMAAIFEFNPNNTIGALLIGTLASMVLWGISTTQVYMYFSAYRDDRMFLKTMVVVVWLSELAHALCISHVLYIYAVTNYGNPLVFLHHVPVTLPLTVVLGALTSAIVQGFYAFRIWTLAPNRIFKLIPIVIWCCILTFFFTIVADTVFAIEAINAPTFDAKYKWLLLFPTWLNVFDDNTITVSMVCLLLIQRRNSLTKTTVMVDRLIKWTMETGMMTSVFGLLSLIFLTRSDQDFIWIAMQIIKARLFANSLLASLNARSFLRQDQTIISAYNLSSRRTGTTNGTGTTRGVESRVEFAPANVGMKVSLRDQLQLRDESDLAGVRVGVVTETKSDGLDV